MPTCGCHGLPSWLKLVAADAGAAATAPCNTPGSPSYTSPGIKGVFVMSRSTHRLPSLDSLIAPLRRCCTSMCGDVPSTVTPPICVCLAVRGVFCVLRYRTEGGAWRCLAVLVGGRQPGTDTARGTGWRRCTPHLLRHHLLRGASGTRPSRSHPGAVCTDFAVDPAVLQKVRAAAASRRGPGVRGIFLP